VLLGQRLSLRGCCHSYVSRRAAGEGPQKTEEKAVLTSLFHDHGAKGGFEPHGDYPHPSRWRVYQFHHFGIESRYLPDSTSPKGSPIPSSQMRVPVAALERFLGQPALELTEPVLP